MKVWSRGIARVTVLVAAAALLMLALAACGGGGNNNEGNGGGNAPAGAITVKMTEFKFDPSTIEAKTGEITFNLVNDGTVEHDMHIEIPGNPQTSELVAPGKSATFTVTINEAGEYQFWCTVPGHRESGMEGTLKVEG
ncbi:cupredoxin domain-containing protein [Sphaerobacter sp.]|uniref:cupredoxin domain-containing protein n=1 Tax=Sphaerobacter sp. TaxID=2099654 RepID=UPI001DC1E21B|nr:cupredoxin domain-containing protein [Sphaerobacter sp.]MBX5446821.1 cupredoxin domain-containing protein [Sphaerobacter sp.]